jgi:hypothetical protein
MHTCSLEVLIPSDVERQFKVENNAGICINVEMMLHACWEYNRYERGLRFLINKLFYGDTPAVSLLLIWHYTHTIQLTNTI